MPEATQFKIRTQLVWLLAHRSFRATAAHASKQFTAHFGSVYRFVPYSCAKTFNVLHVFMKPVHEILSPSFKKWQQ